MLPFLFPCGNLDDEMMILLMVQKSGEKTTWDVKKQCKWDKLPYQLVQDFSHQEYVSCFLFKKVMLTNQECIFDRETSMDSLTHHMG